MTKQGATVHQRLLFIPVLPNLQEPEPYFKLTLNYESSYRESVGFHSVYFRPRSVTKQGATVHQRLLFIPVLPNLQEPEPYFKLTLNYESSYRESVGFHSVYFRPRSVTKQGATVHQRLLFIPVLPNLQEPEPYFKLTLNYESSYRESVGFHSVYFRPRSVTKQGATVHQRLLFIPVLPNLQEPEPYFKLTLNYESSYRESVGFHSVYFRPRSVTKQGATVHQRLLFIPVLPNLQEPEPYFKLTLNYESSYSLRWRGTLNSFIIFIKHAINYTLI